MAEFTHFDQDGNAHMVDVGAKPATVRTAIVKGYVKMQPDTLAMIQRGDAKRVMFWRWPALPALWVQNKQHH